MCGKAPKAPKVVERDPVAEQAAAEAKAMVAANAELASTRKRRQRSTLLTAGAGGSTAPAASLLSTAKPIAGGG